LTQTATPLVVASSLDLTYPSGRRGVTAIDLIVHAGESVVVLGPNGSGKSTLMRLLAGLLRPGNGNVRVLGADPASSTFPRRRVGVALDRPAHWEPLTALENVELIARAAGLSRSGAASEGTALLQRFGLDTHVPVSEHSLGMNRKLLLAETFVSAPEVLLLDEPTLGLDPTGVDALSALLAERTAAGAAAVIASNDVRAAPALATRIVFLLDGRKVVDDRAEALLSKLRARTRLEVILGGDGVRAVDVVARAGAPSAVTLTAQNGAVVAESSRGAEPLPDLLRWLLDQGVRVSDVRVREPDLGDVFKQLTGATLGEDR
jgi:ABC-2 type transport system ATP-binding protein